MIQKSAAQKDQRKNLRDSRSDVPSQRKTQAARILAKLIEARGSWVPVLEISTKLGILQFTARLFELRSIGFHIENRMEVMPDGTRHSFYRLISSSAPDVVFDMPGIKITAPVAPASSFGDPEHTSEAPAPPSAPAPAPVLESAGDPSPPAPEAAADSDWFTRTTGKRRAVIERESLWLWERGR